MAGTGSTGELRTPFASTAGGVMTDEAGAVTGDLELLTRPGENGGLEALVRYAGAGEWYTVTGSPVPDPAGGADHGASHEAMLALLTTPGPTQDGNELPVELWTM